jgi:DNA-binding XRE family transcriptional regulator
MQHDANPPDVISSPKGNDAAIDATSGDSKGAEKGGEGPAPNGGNAVACSPSKTPSPSPLIGKPNRVRENRIAKLMSKAELARRANLSVLTIDRVEKGFGCRMHTKRKILEALGLNLTDRVRVFGEEE